MPLMPGMPPGMMGPGGPPGMPPGPQGAPPGPQGAPPGMPPGGPPPGPQAGPPQPLPPEVMQALLARGGPGGPGGRPSMPEKIMPEDGMDAEMNAALEIALENPGTRKMLAEMALELLSGEGGPAAMGPGPSGRQDVEPNQGAGLGAMLGG